MIRIILRLSLSVLVFSCLISCSSFIKVNTNPVENPPEIELAQLFPNSSNEDFISCGKVFDDEANYQQALSCSNDSGVFPKKLIPGPKPKCWVVKHSSPDITQGPVFNYLRKIISQFVITPEGQLGVEVEELSILGLFDPKTDNMFIVENVDGPAVYRHELQHHFLQLADLEHDNSHSSPLWKKCEPPTYEPSHKAKIYGWFNRFYKLFTFQD